MSIDGEGTIKIIPTEAVSIKNEFLNKFINNSGELEYLVKANEFN